MPATLVKDAQRHGLRVKPIDVQHSDWPCTLERESGVSSGSRCGSALLCARIAQQVGEALVVSARAGRAFIRSTISRCACLAAEERSTLLANIGALNSLGEVSHRRDALWQVEYAGRFAGPLLKRLAEQDGESPLAQMTIEERLVAISPGPESLWAGIQWPFIAPCRGWALFGELAKLHGRAVRIAGCVIARQRPGTAKGFVFLSIEDETGIANAIITPAVYEQFSRW